MRVAGEFSETVFIAHRLARLAKTDLVRNDDTHSRFLQHECRGMPSGGTEIFAMQQNRDRCFGLAGWVVQVGHLHRLAVRNEIE